MTNSATVNDDITAGGTITLSGNVTGTAGQAVLASTGTTTNIVNGTGGTVTGVDVILSATGAVGTNASRIATTAGNLAAKAASGSVYVSETDAVTLKDLTSSFTGSTAVTNSATVVYDVTAAGTITTGAVSVNTTTTGDTNLTTTGAAINNIVLGSAVGNTTGNTVLTSVGNITGAGLVSGNNVTLDSATGVGTGTAGRVNTTAATLAARSTTSGGVFVNETNAVTLNNIGAVGNTTAANGNYDVVAAGTITVAGAVTANGSGTVSLNATTAASNVLINAAVSSTSGAINVTAGQTITEAGAGTLSTSGLLTTQSNDGQTLNNANTVGSFNATNNDNTGSAGVVVGSATGNIALTNTAATLTITGLSQTATPSSAFQLPLDAVNGNVAIINTGNITNSAGAAMNVAGNTSLKTLGVATNGINIGKAALDTFNTGSLTFNTTGGAVNIAENSNMLVTGINTAGALTLASTANMDSTVGTSITATSANLLAGGVIGGPATGDAPTQFKSTVSNVNFDSFGTLNVPTGAIVVSASGVDPLNVVSVDIVGSSLSGRLTLGSPVPPAAVLFNGLAQTSVPVVATTRSGPATTGGLPAALVVAENTTFTATGDVMQPGSTSTTGVFMGTAFPTESVNVQVTSGQGAVGMVAPIVKLRGIGLNVAADVAKVTQCQTDDDASKQQMKCTTN